MFEFVTVHILGIQPMQLLRMSASGLVATGVNYGALFLFLTLLGLGSIAAIAIAFVLSTGTNFVLQKFWAYNSRHPGMLRKQLVFFLLNGLCMLGLNEVLFYLLDEAAHIGYLPTEIVLTVILSIIGYYATKWIFTHRPAAVRA